MLMSVLMVCDLFIKINPYKIFFRYEIACTSTAGAYIAKYRNISKVSLLQKQN